MTKRANAAMRVAMTDEIRTPRAGVIRQSPFFDAVARGDTSHRIRTELWLMAGDLLLLADHALEFSAFDAERADVDMGVFGLVDAIENVVAILSPAAAVKGLEITCAIAGTVPSRVVGDPDRLSQVLLNLAGSIVRFSRLGCVSIAVGLERRRSEGIELRFEIGDGGAVIDADALSVLALEFGRIDETATGRYGGAGLGIVASNRLLKVMGGRIAVSDSADRGNVFSFIVPLGLERAGGGMTPESGSNFSNRSKPRFLDEAARIYLASDGTPSDCV